MCLCVSQVTHPTFFTSCSWIWGNLLTIFKILSVSQAIINFYIILCILEWDMLLNIWSFNISLDIISDRKDGPRIKSPEFNQLTTCGILVRWPPTASTDSIINYLAVNIKYNNIIEIQLLLVLVSVSLTLGINSRISMCVNSDTHVESRLKRRLSTYVLSTYHLVIAPSLLLE